MEPRGPTREYLESVNNNANAGAVRRPRKGDGSPVSLPLVFFSPSFGEAGRPMRHDSASSSGGQASSVWGISCAQMKSKDN